MPSGADRDGYPLGMHDLAPLFRLRLRTPRLELRLGSEAEVRALGELAERGVHPPDEMPFSIPWTDGIGEPDFLDGFCEYHRAQLAEWSPESWHLPFLVWCEGELVGGQSVFAKEFASRREISTGSWLGLAFQRRGIGTEMRAAALEFGFSHLGAVAAELGVARRATRARAASPRSSATCRRGHSP